MVFDETNCCTLVVSPNESSSTDNDRLLLDKIVKICGTNPGSQIKVQSS